VNGVSLRYYHPGHTYDLNSNLAEYLVIQGFALFEMRTAVKDRRATRRRYDRRRPSNVMKARDDAGAESR